MTETFEVGQKVRRSSGADGEIKYGPYQKAGTYLTNYYLVDFGDDTCRELRGVFLSAIPETPKFSVGDVVTLATRRGAKATVEYGPFDDRDVYLVKLVDAPADEDEVRTFTAMAHVMTPVPAPTKVGDKVRVLRNYADGASVHAGDVFTVAEVEPDGRIITDGRGYANRWYFTPESVERVDDETTYTHAGMTYDLSAKYKDRDGDVWQFARIGGEVRGNYTNRSVEAWDDTLAEVVRSYGPLTRV